jgi:CRP-like cAMP-binding protein
MSRSNKIHPARRLSSLPTGTIEHIDRHLSEQLHTLVSVADGEDGLEDVLTSVLFDPIPKENGTVTVTASPPHTEGDTRAFLPAVQSMLRKRDELLARHDVQAEDIRNLKKDNANGADIDAMVAALRLTAKEYTDLISQDGGGGGRSSSGGGSTPRHLATLDAVRYKQRTATAAFKRGKEEIYKELMEGNQQMAVISSLVLGAAAAMLYDGVQGMDGDDFAEFYEAAYGGRGNRSHALEVATLIQSHAQSMGQLFLGVTTALNLFAASILTLNLFYSKKSKLLILSGEEALNSDTHVMFIERTHGDRSLAIIFVIASIPIFTVALALEMFKCGEEGNAECSGYELLTGATLVVTALATIFFMLRQSFIFAAEMDDSKLWHCGLADLTSFVQKRNPSVTLASLYRVNGRMSRQLFRQGDTIFTEDQSCCNVAYLVSQGEVAILKGGNQVTTIHRGCLVGELELNREYPGSKRTFTLKAQTDDVTLWKIPRKVYRKYLMSALMSKRSRCLKLIKEAGTKVQQLFSDLTDFDIISLCGVLEAVSFRDEEVVVEETDLTNDMYLILDGEARVCKESMVCPSNPEGYICTLSRGDYFGETSLVTDRPRTATVVAKAVTNVGAGSAEVVLECAKLSREGFSSMRGKLDDRLKEHARNIFIANRKTYQLTRQVMRSFRNTLLHERRLLHSDSEGSLRQRRASFGSVLETDPFFYEDFPEDYTFLEKGAVNEQRAVFSASNLQGNHQKPSNALSLAVGVDLEVLTDEYAMNAPPKSSLYG